MKGKSDEHNCSCPLVLTVGGHDPSGAGLHADIETCAALECMAVSIVTALTTQNTAFVYRVIPTDPVEIRRQIVTLLDELEIDVCKIGLVPTRAASKMLGTLFSDELDGCPLILDPVLSAGSGGDLSCEDMRESILTELVPHATLVTPNESELQALTSCSDAEQGILKLRQAGAKAVLVKDCENNRRCITNRLYLPDRLPEVFEMRRFPGTYHGTGCTLASAVACYYAVGMPLRTAVANAQTFTHSSVAAAHKFGASQAIPNRFSTFTR